MSAEDMYDVLSGATTGREREPVKFRVDILARGEVRWATNALRFDTDAEALACAHDLYGRSRMAWKMRVGPKTHPTTKRASRVQNTRTGATGD